MKYPEWTKPAVYGAAAGAIVVAIAGFSVGGWVTGGTAEKMARVMSNEQVTMALVPVCIDLADKDPERASKVKLINEAALYNRHNEVMNAGWATVPGTTAANRELARACLDGLKLDES